MRLPALLLLALFSSPALARDDSGCTPDIEAALRSIDPKIEIAGPAVSPHCKPWPPSAGKVVAAVMAFEQGQQRDRKWVGVLALLDARTKRILNSRRFDVEEDSVTAISTYSLKLDTANYALAPDVRAIGLRFSSSAPGPSAVDASFGTELTLFVPDARRLRPVLALVMNLSRAIEGCLGKCPNAVWDSADLTIATGPTGPHGWNDLLVTASVTRNSNSEQAGFDATTRRERVVYRYDGAAYTSSTPGARWWDEHSYCCSLKWENR
jgi:hypothetical protein